VTEPSDATPEQAGLFGSDEEFRYTSQQYKGMPEFVQDDLEPYATILVHFATPADLRAFETLVGQSARRTTRTSAFIWYPKAPQGHFTDLRYRDASGE
jgi:hypothetical protein